jgi:hypothetical protein
VRGDPTMKGLRACEDPETREEGTHPGSSQTDPTTVFG